MNDWHQRTTCRLCGSTHLQPFLNLGELPLAGAFLHPHQISAEKRYPLTVTFCGGCHEIQLLETLNPQILFQDYRYLSSTTATLSQHFQDYARDIVGQFLKPDALVVEIGSNDGVLLKPLAACGVRAIGVEPADNVAAIARTRGCEVYNNFFDVEVARRILNEQGPADAICANNVFAHIDDIASVTRGIDRLLSPSGVFIFEVQCLFDLLDGFQYDMIYHEHLMYHSVGALNRFFDRFEMHIFDVKRVPTHCGSMRVHVQRNHAGVQPITERLVNFIQEEQARGLHLIKTFEVFGRSAQAKAANLGRLVDDLLASGKRVVGYGASGRASVHVNLSHLTSDKIPYVVDSSPERRGRVMPGTHNAIVDVDTFRADPPDFAVVFAYNYLDEIQRKEAAFTATGGKWIVPLPTPSVLS